MKRAHGYTTNDGTFFEDKLLAEYHEARTALIEKLRQDKIDADKLITIILDHFGEVENVVAIIAKCKVTGYAFSANGDAFGPDTPIFSESASIDTEGARSTTSVVKLTPDQPESMPDIRPRSQRKTVRS